MVTLWMLAIFLVLAALRVPVCVSMGFGALAGLVLMDLPADTMVRNMLDSVRAIPLLAVPFFILAAAIMNLGASATNANVPFAEQLAILGMLQGTMKSGEVAGTAYRAFLDKAGKAGKALGLPFLDSNKRLKSTTEIIGLLRRKYGETSDS